MDCTTPITTGSTVLSREDLTEAQWVMVCREAPRDMRPAGRKEKPDAFLYFHGVGNGPNYFGLVSMKKMKKYRYLDEGSRSGGTEKDEM